GHEPLPLDNRPGRCFEGDQADPGELIDLGRLMCIEVYGAVEDDPVSLNYRLLRRARRGCSVAG
ncbi:hypothetical protein JZU54_07000, partial [bacterium]|nr:hypothetical protein [bacterium]